MEVREYVTRLLDALGVGRNYRGYMMSVEAICRVLDDEANLFNVHENVMKPIAVQYACTGESVARNIRTVICRIWQVNAQLLQQMAPYPLSSPPSVTEFLDIMATYVYYRKPAFAQWTSESRKTSGA